MRIAHLLYDPVAKVSGSTLVAIVALLACAAVACGGGDGGPQTTSSRSTMVAYFAELDTAWADHLHRFDTAPTDVSYEEGTLAILDSIDTMLDEIDRVEAPPEAEGAQRRLVDRFREVTDGQREGIAIYGATATLTPEEIEAIEPGDPFTPLDAACEELLEIAATYDVEIEFLCLGDESD